MIGRRCCDPWCAITPSRDELRGAPELHSGVRRGGAAAVEARCRACIGRPAPTPSSRGVAIEAGAHLVVWYAGGNRDPVVFSEPDEVDVERDNIRKHLAFGRRASTTVSAPRSGEPKELSRSRLSLSGSRTGRSRTTWAARTSSAATCCAATATCGSAGDGSRAPARVAYPAEGRSSVGLPHRRGEGANPDRARCSSETRGRRSTRRCGSG